MGNADRLACLTLMTIGRQKEETKFFWGQGLQNCSYGIHICNEEGCRDVQWTKSIGT